nr:excalibur calcium-binding domain-containing protein [Comamonas koreensis]
MPQALVTTTINPAPVATADPYDERNQRLGPIPKPVSQITSCKEAKLFLKNCPDTKMDGDNDGVPCERQLCNVNKRP